MSEFQIKLVGKTMAFLEAVVKLADRKEHEPMHIVTEHITNKKDEKNE